MTIIATEPIKPCFQELEVGDCFTISDNAEESIYLKIVTPRPQSGDYNAVDLSKNTLTRIPPLALVSKIRRATLSILR